MGTTTQVVRQTIFFDGVCNLCNRWVNWIIDHDGREQFTFASLQSTYARKLLHGLGVYPETLEGVVFFRADKAYQKSDAVLEIAKQMGGIWKLLYAFRILPRSFRDGVYDVIARNRYRWFGKRSSCRVPSPHLKKRFLDS